jgi:hypothetical protein
MLLDVPASPVQLCLAAQVTLLPDETAARDYLTTAADCDNWTHCSSSTQQL